LQIGTSLSGGINFVLPDRGFVQLAGCVAK
jgi:hypothetical protein